MSDWAAIKGQLRKVRINERMNSAVKGQLHKVMQMTPQMKVGYGDGILYQGSEDFEVECAYTSWKKAFDKSIDGKILAFFLCKNGVA